MAAGINRWLSIVFSLVVLVAIGWGSVLFLGALLGSISKVNPTVLAALIAGAAMVSVSVLSVILSRYYESRALIVKENRDKKMPVYEELMGFLFRNVVYASKLGKPLEEKEMLEFFASFTQKFMVWGADEVVREWSAFRLKSVKADDPFGVLFAYEDLIRAIRRDLGHSNKGLKRGDILTLFVNDIDTVLSKATHA